MGKKKKKKNIPHDPEAILKRAEKFFKKGNYLLAGKEFEKLGAAEDRKDLIEKMKICEMEVRKQEARDLLKKARKMEKGGNPGEAVKCFEDAYEVLREEWISEKIEQLRNVALNLNVSRAAKDAEAAGDYLKAAELYDRASADHETEHIVLRKAVCLVRAEAYPEAVSAFQEIALENPGHLYDFGFSLAKTGKYCECLKTWDSIPSQDESFLEQKTLVRHLLVSDLYAEFKKRGDPERVYTEGKYLIDGGYEYSGLSGMVEQSMFAWIEVLWGSEDYNGILELLRQTPLQMDPVLVQLYAKVCFKQVEKSGIHGEDLSMFWLSAVYSDVFESQFPEAAQCERVRTELMRRAEDLLKYNVQSGEETAEKVLAQWALEKEATVKIHDLVRKRKKSGLPVLSPRLAERTGQLSTTLEFVRKNRRFFKNQENYLRVGCCYSPARESFYLLAGGEYEEAVQTVPAGERGNEFVDYARGRVLFAYGFILMENGTSPPDRYLESVCTLFETSPEYERQFIEKALDVEDAAVLQRFEEALVSLHGNRPSVELAKALSLVMSRRAEEMAIRRLMNDKVLSKTLKKALEVNPENEHARGLLGDAESNLEMMALEKALHRYKMNMACKIVIESEKDVVREAFFDYFERSMDQLEEEADSKSEMIFFLKDTYKWIARVDNDHDLLYDIEEKIESLEGANI